MDIQHNQRNWGKFLNDMLWDIISTVLHVMKFFLKVSVMQKFSIKRVDKVKLPH